MAIQDLHKTDDLLLCTACGAQYDVDESSGKKSCRICDDPRQFIPPEGQSFTTLSKLRQDSKGYKNVFRQTPEDPKVWEIWTEPKFAIGQRACLIQTRHGNILWDMVAFLDEATVEKIKELGGLEFIIISHPHFYTTHGLWATVFDCPIYLAKVDADSWANVSVLPSADRRLLTEKQTELMPGVTANIVGGHFPGSMVLNTTIPNTDRPSLFAADAIFSVVSAQEPTEKPGKVSFAFMWSIPNMIPLSADTIHSIWNALKPLEFDTVYGVMALTSNVRETPGWPSSLKKRVLDSAQIAVKAMGYADHSIHNETI